MGVLAAFALSACTSMLGSPTSRQQLLADTPSSCGGEEVAWKMMNSAVSVVAQEPTATAGGQRREEQRWVGWRS
jgi:hypothetical protein